VESFYVRQHVIFERSGIETMHLQHVPGSGKLFLS